MGVRERLRQRKLPEKLKAIREALGLTQPQLLEVLGFPTLNQSNISSYELGRREPPLEVILKYAELANICTDVLISDSLELPGKLPCKKTYYPH